MTTREDLESYLLRMDLDYEEVDDGMWIVKPQGDGTNIVVHYSPPVVVLRLKVMEIQPGGDDGRYTALYRKLLELNATDIVHGSYGIEAEEVVLSDALELETLDFGELRSSYESMFLAASSHLPELVGLVPVAQEG
ncbi:MAG: hypothetical protein ACREMQ_06625 [Longimicrobiales bacterium]